MPRIVYVRNIDAGEYFESFLVSAVAAILGIRAFLHVTGYPKVGGDALHVAHMLWGGLLMAAALLLLLGFLGKQVKSLSAVVGGLGFGTFIDELGKFLTHDNDYFFEPTVALIYVVFILMYIGMTVVQRRAPSAEESVANALEITLEAVRRDMDETERQRAQELLRQAAPDDPVGQALADALRRIEHVVDPTPGVLSRMVMGVRHAYGRAVRNAWFPRAVITFFVLHSLVVLVQAAWLIDELRGFFDWGELIFSIVPAVLVLFGVLHMPKDRLSAYRMFHRAVLVLIFVTQFFAFYHHQFAATVGLFWNIIVLVTLRYVIHEEVRFRRVVVG
jgi:hypothetical protein